MANIYRVCNFGGVLNVPFLFKQLFWSFKYIAEFFLWDKNCFNNFLKVFIQFFPDLSFNNFCNMHFSFQRHHAISVTFLTSLYTLHMVRFGENSMLRIHPKPDRNCKKLTLCTACIKVRLTKVMKRCKQKS